MNHPDRQFSECTALAGQPHVANVIKSDGIIGGSGLFCGRLQNHSKSRTSAANLSNRKLLCLARSNSDSSGFININSV